MIRWQNPSVIVALSGTLALVLFISIPAIEKSLAKLMRLAAAVGRSGTLALAIVFSFALIVAIVPSIIWSPPVPYVHDEFAYLLAGNTFAHFRLTNPPHRLADFFDTIHVLQHPTYASKFPIGQGVALAIGFWLGLPIAGVWISTAIACASVWWMLRAFVPPRWALIGAMLCALHPLLAWWTQGYWGGSVAMIGGALLVGAAGRARRSSFRFAHGIVFGVGLAILANSRPLEGLLLAILLAIWMRRSLLRVIVPAAIVLAPTFAFMGYYNWRVTGNALELPYTLHARQYMIAPLLFGQRENAVHPYSNESLEKFFIAGEPKEYREQLPFLSRIVPSIIYKWKTLLGYFFNPMILAIPFLASFKKRRAMVLIFFALPTIHMLLTPWLRSVYMAPLMACFFIAVVSGMRILSRWKIGRAVVFVAVISTLAAQIAWAKDLSARAHAPLAMKRAAIVDDLRAIGGKHLVIVHYGPHYEPAFEFVYNDADIDNSPIVFAHSLGTEKDRQLLDYYRDRTVWDLYYDNGPFSFKPHERN